MGDALDRAIDRCQDPRKEGSPHQVAGWRPPEAGDFDERQPVTEFRTLVEGKVFELLEDYGHGPFGFLSDHVGGIRGPLRGDLDLLSQTLDLSLEQGPGYFIGTGRNRRLRTRPYKLADPSHSVTRFLRGLHDYVPWYALKEHISQNSNRSQLSIKRLLMKLVSVLQLQKATRELALHVVGNKPQISSRTPLGGATTYSIDDANGRGNAIGFIFEKSDVIEVKFHAVMSAAEDLDRIKEMIFSLGIRSRLISGRG